MQRPFPLARTLIDRCGRQCAQYHQQQESGVGADYP